MPKSAVSEQSGSNDLFNELSKDPLTKINPVKNEKSKLIKKGSWIWFLKGAAGLGQSLMGINTVISEVRRMRMATCMKCRHLNGNPLRSLMKVTCNICGCIVWHKSNIRTEECPEGKWHKNQSDN